MDVYDEVDRRENNQSKFPNNDFVLQLLICGRSHRRIKRKDKTTMHYLCHSSNLAANACEQLLTNTYRQLNNKAVCIVMLSLKGVARQNFFCIAVWLQSQTDNSLVSDRQTVPFLPVNPEFSSTRNQGRQKLARFNAREFATLIIDILSDAKRRQQGIGTPASSASTPSREKGTMA